jgi:hypothetical protein
MEELGTVHGGALFAYGGARLDKDYGGALAWECMEDRALDC